MKFKQLKSWKNKKNKSELHVPAFFAKIIKIYYLKNNCIIIELFFYQKYYPVKSRAVNTYN